MHQFMGFVCYVSEFFHKSEFSFYGQILLEQFR